MKHTILATFLLGIFALSSSNGYACFCDIPDVHQAFSEAQAVFVGEVTEIKKLHRDDYKEPLAVLYAVKFKVEKSWKGFVSQEITILSAQDGAGCLNWGSFIEGKKYLVYAEKTQAGNLAVLFGCNRTASIFEPEVRLSKQTNVLGLSIVDPSEDLKTLDAKSNFTFDFVLKNSPSLQQK